MEALTINNYRLTSLEEPSDEVLSRLMHEDAVEAMQKRAAAAARFFG